MALATTQANVDAIAAAADADRVLLCAIAPYDANTTAANAMNAAYVTQAATNGWDYVDPWAAYRQGSGAWTGGASGDGVHPTAAVSQAAGLVIRAAILAML